MRRFRFITEEEHLKDLRKYQSFFEEMKCNYGKEIDIENTGLTYKDFVDKFDIQNGSFKYLGSGKKNILWSFNMHSVVEIETENIKQEVKRFRFKTKQELKESNEWSISYGMPIGWGYEKDLLRILGTEITDPSLIAECISGKRIKVSENEGILTRYYIEIKEEEKMKRYRFKTEKEFGRKLPIGWIPEMLPNLGKELTAITSGLERIIVGGGDFNYGGETKGNHRYRYSDIVEIVEELKRIPKEEWEDIDLHNDIIGVEVQNGDKFYLVHNTEGFVNINLKKHSTSNYSDSVDIESGLRQCLDGVGKKVYQFNDIEELIKWATT